MELQAPEQRARRPITSNRFTNYAPCLHIRQHNTITLPPAHLPMRTHEDKSCAKPASISTRHGSYSESLYAKSPIRSETSSYRRGNVMVLVRRKCLCGRRWSLYFAMRWQMGTL